MIKFSEWKDCITDPPKEDGNYVVLKMNNRDKDIFYVTNMSYTVAFGWNTTYGSIDHVIDFSHCAEAGFTTLWAVVKYEPINIPSCLTNEERRQELLERYKEE